ncbi:MAG: photosystem I assembly protein Ycf3 [Planctomycetes bacterium ADurb.Bin401]|nr:MAG: photosystem I assembly protein Ycf3 [Planctomycetes bacterium ADurb.Bin401]
MKKHRDYLLILVVFCLLPVAGCIQGQATVSLKPDGSGKVLIETVIDLPDSGDPDKYQTYYKILNQTKNSLLMSEGIDAWQNVDWKFLNNGKFYFKGEAYFANINDVTIQVGKNKSNLKIYYIEEEGKPIIVELGCLKPQSQTEFGEAKKNSAIRYNLFSEDVRQMLEDFRLDVIISAGSKPVALNEFEKLDEKTVHYLVQGKRMEYLLDYVREKELYDIPERWNYNRDDFINNYLLPAYIDNRGPIRLYLDNDGAVLCDYEKEKQDAKKQIIRILEKLDAEAVKAKIKINKNTLAGSSRDLTQQNIAGDESINSQLLNGLKLESRDDYAKAIEIYSIIIEDDKSEAKYLAQAYYRTGICYFEMGDDKKAIEQFEKVINKFPSERVPAIRSSNMIRDIRKGIAVRKSDKQAEIPVVVSSAPQLYVEDVNFANESITIKFSHEMDSSNWFYSSFAPGKLPAVTAEPYFDSSGQYWTLPVKLEPYEIYAIAFNCGDAVKKNSGLIAGFRSKSGTFGKPFVLVFATADVDNVPTEIDEDLLIKADEINSNQKKDFDSSPKSVLKARQPEK